MILVTLGTQDKSFIRLLNALERFKQDGLIQDEIIVQAGYTAFETNNMQVFSYLSQPKLDELRQKADVIITHAGVGSILDALKFNKVVIGVARLKVFEEHANDHQCEILDTFSHEGYILKIEDLNDLPKLLLEAKNFKPKPYPFDNSQIIQTVLDYIHQH